MKIVFKFIVVLRVPSVQDRQNNDTVRKLVERAVIVKYK